MSHPTPRPLAAGAALLLSFVLGCASLPGTRTQQGAVLGGIAGGATGAAVGGNAAGAVIGTAAGAVAGGLIGRYLEQQGRELDAIPDATVTPQDDRLLVSFPGDVFFDSGSPALSREADPRIASVAQTLLRYPESRVVVRGHTDATGSAARNQDLSDARADAVRDALVAEGVPDARIEAVGLGSQFPVASNATDAGRRQNRRVEIEIVPDRERLQSGAGAGSQQRGDVIGGGAY
jgi:outer membrane protein OmpA-like peptidoglycan-associated protein